MVGRLCGCFGLGVMLAVSGVAKEYHVYILGGQSNMVGYGMTADLDPEEQKPVDGVMIFQGRNEKDNKVGRGGNGKWETLAPGQGNWAKCFGPELFFGRKMKELYPDRNIAIIKYARTGSSIAVEAAGHWGCWYPEYSKENGINQWDHFLKTLENARVVKDIDGDGEPDTLVYSGIAWMQGESDASKSEAIAKAYAANLKVLMDAMRAELKTAIPVAIAHITNSNDAKAKGLPVKGGDVLEAHRHRARTAGQIC